MSGSTKYYARRANQEGTVKIRRMLRHKLRMARKPADPRRGSARASRRLDIQRSVA